MIQRDNFYSEADLITAIPVLEDGLHVFGLQNRVAHLLPKVHTSVPLLASSGEPDQLRRIVDCFVNWEGEVQIAALQDEGLLDVWVV